MVERAKLVDRGRHQVWACPCCDRTLGEVYGDKVTVKAGERLITFPLDAEVQQHCPRCGSVSSVRKDAA